MYFAVHSNDEEYLNAYLEHFEFNIEIGGDVSSDLSIPANTQKSGSQDIENYLLDEEPKIIIELITENIKEKENAFSLITKENTLKSANSDIFQWGSPVGYFTDGSFIGAFMYGEGYDMYIKWRGKENWYSWSYEDYSDLFRLLAAYNDAAWWGSGDPYKRGCVIYPHLSQTSINYTIEYSKETFRGSDCSLGYYDGRNCFVKAAPSGTTAFLYPDKYGSLYYTKASGSEPCPAGGYFDGANCKVAEIPSSTSGFRYNNSLYVKADKIVE